MREIITVSNGEQFREIAAADLSSLQEEGFYQPAEFGMTIVGNDEFQFEVPITDVDAASESGLRDWLANERTTGPGGLPTDKAGSRGRSSTARNEATEKTALISDLGQSLDQSLGQSEILAQQERDEQEQELQAATGLSWILLSTKYWLVARQAVLQRQLGSHGISIMVHVAILLLLASLVLVEDRQEKSVMIASISAPRDSIQEVIIESDSLEITDPTEVDVEDSPPETEEVEMAETESVMVDFMAAVSGEAVKPPAVVSKDDGEGKKVTEKSSAVFGTKVTANDYVFVIDNSNSMSKGRFETALNELMIAVNGLNRKQRFYVIFYSDTAYGMMYPNPVTQMVLANKLNKQRLYQWLLTVPLCLKTNGKEAIQAAFDMEPDVIYVLGDGAFTDGASNYFAKQPRTKTILHTRGMQVTGNTAKSFAALAVAHGGNYKDVGVSSAALAMAQRNPRPRNNKRNGVWGLTLPRK